MYPAIPGATRHDKGPYFSLSTWRREAREQDVSLAEMVRRFGDRGSRRGLDHLLPRA